MIHAYAIAGHAPATTVRGVSGAAVETLACGDLHAVISRHDHAVESSRDAVLAHAGVVNAVTERAAALPVRFGVRYRDDAHLRDIVHERAAALAALLARIGDCVEFGLRCADAEPALVRVPAHAGEASGRAYLEQRLAEHRAREDAAQRARDRLRAGDPLVALATEVAERTGATGPERVFLVRRSRAQEFAAAAERIAAEGALRVSGPWPPYSFVDDVADDDER